MDPYLEAADIWPDFRDALAAEIRANLNQHLPAPYYARLEIRPEIGVVDAEQGTSYQRRIVPDVSVVRQPDRQSAQQSVATLELPRDEVSQSIEINVPSEDGKHAFVEIRDSRRGHRLVTLIEIVSPANKLLGLDRTSYLQKHHEVYQSDASLVEIDLLRGGERLLHNALVADAMAQLQPQPEYLILVNRAWLRAGRVSYQAFPVALREMLPCVPVPLREGEPEVLLDLQYVFYRVYDSGPYRRGAIDYADAPQPPLRPEDAAWAGQLLRDHGLLPA
jgi:hypothetical protein